MPEDFGIVGMATVFIILANTFVDSGFLQALIQKKDADSDDFSVVFKFSMIASILLSILIFAIAGKVGAFYDQPEVVSITKVLSVLVLIGSISMIQKASLLKELKFELRAKIEIVAILVSGAVSIVLARNGYGAWSLVYRSLINSLLVTILLWIFHPMKVNLRVPWKRLWPLLRFGGKVFIADQVEGISNQIAQLLIGKQYTAQDLGFYSKAQQYQTILSNTAVVSINKVIFPSFSQIQDDDVKLKRGYQALIKLTMIILVPFMTGSVLIADPLIPMIIGDKWMETVPYFQVLCLSAVFYPFTVYNLNIIKVKGLANLYFKIALISKGIMIPAIIVGLKFDIMGLVVALLIQRIAAAVINSLYSGKLVDYSLKEQLRDVVPYFIFSAVLFAGIWTLKALVLDLMFSNLLVILIVSILMIIGYGALLLLFSRKDISSMRALLKMMKDS